MTRREVSLRLTRYLDATPAEVWRTLTDPESLARWLARRAAVDATPGGTFDLRLAEDPSTWMSGRVLAVEPERVLELDWRYPGEEPSIVRFELVPGEQGTRLVVDHRRLDERSCMAYARSWERALDRLERGVARAKAAL